MSEIRPVWLFDDSPIPDPLGYGARAVDFLRKLRHPKSTAPKHQFQLFPFQERLVRKVYGDVHADGRRKVRTLYLRMGRGGRKTSLTGALALLHLFGPERVTGGKIIAAASDRSQAKIQWEEAAGIIGMSARLSQATQKREAPVFTISHPKSGSQFQAISADGEGKHGLTYQLVCTDELHVWSHNRELWRALTTGLPKIPNTLHVITTTAGYGVDGIAGEIEAYARDVATGAVIDETFLSVIFEVPEELDWKDERAWHLANPGLPYGFPDIDGLRTAAKQATRLPQLKDDFLRFHLGRWQDGAASPWLDLVIYDAGARDISIDDYEGEPCWLAVDFGLVSDLSAVVAAFPRDDDEIHVFAWFFVPEDNLRAKAEADRAPYIEARDNGYLVATPGNVVDRRILADKVRELADRFAVQEAAFDPYRLKDWAADLAEQDGLPMVEHRQGWASMGPAIAKLQNLILAGKFIHDGNSLLRWCFSNVVTKTDSSGNASFHKGRSRGRIDGAVASAMAVGRAVTGESGLSIYAGDDRPAGLLFV
ncbi:terminase large subunit [Mesorhizobium sp. LHD-90]|uniref:terminase large subunit n=1 Tax=Mesorhizobium sp. LHD-90 TaxID=3071414 RepID=UPI0027E0C432|nr:terminase TerL endonuclease subunit [Mesorhizobium sp. LHD-90]MDQ6434389.1 terminase large subunit [Mesorhizobium sp. LHD-90]